MSKVIIQREEKMKTVNFSDIDNDVDLAAYLKRVLFRPLSNKRGLYHYTKFTTLKEIHESNTLRLYKSSGMNDAAESESLMENDLSNRVFYTCFSMGQESAEMWNMYTDVNDGCILEVKYKSAKDWLINPVVIKSPEVRDSCLKSEIKEKPEFNSVAYYTLKDGKNSPLSCMSVYNNGYSESYKSAILAGMIKRDFWRFENEARLVVRTEQDYPCNYLELELTSDFWEEISVIISPFSNNARKDEIENFCRDKNIRFMHSQYENEVNYNDTVYIDEKAETEFARGFDCLLKKSDAKKYSCEPTYGTLMAALLKQRINGLRIIDEKKLKRDFCGMWKCLGESKIAELIHQTIESAKVKANTLSEV